MHPSGRRDADRCGWGLQKACDRANRTLRGGGELFASGFYGIAQPPECSGSDGLAEDEAQVEGPDVDEQPLEYVFVFAQVGSPHGAGIVAVGEAALDNFAAPFSVGDAFLASDALAIFVYGLLLSRFVFPLSPTAIRFADTGGQTVVFVQRA